MAVKNRFKWVRSLPQVLQTGDPGFYSYNLPAMRQIPTSVAIAHSDGHITPIISAFVPASSWGQGKVLMLRGWYRFNIPGSILPPTYNVNEAIKITGGGVTLLPTPAPFTPAPGTYSTWIERFLIRADPVIMAFDHGDVLEHNWANEFENVQHVFQIPAVGGSFDYAAQIQVDLTMQMAATIPGANINCMFAETFLEQATNLGRLP